jgi:hypothetical protein
VFVEIASYKLIVLFTVPDPDSNDPLPLIGIDEV